MSPSRTEKIFTRIYTKSSWGDHESKSGAGSGIARTESLRPALTRLALDLEIRSLLDLPCGDFNWMRHTDLPGIDYTGVDIVQPLIERNQAMYTQPGRRFLRLDMICDALPRTDLILCRDGFVHLSFGDITRALRSSKQILQCGMQQRSWSHFRDAVDLIQGGSLGRIPQVRTY